MSAAPEHNLNHLLVAQHLAAGRGDDVAVIDDHGRWTFAQLDHAAARAGAVMRDAGVGAGDRVAIVLDDSREWCAAFLGATRIGAVAAGLEPGGRHLEVILQDLAPTVVVTESPATIPGAHATIGLTADALDAPGSGTAIEPVAPTTLAYMVFSSGSTGRPKGVMHAHRDLRASVAGYASEVLGLSPTDRCHSSAKLFASLGFGNGFFRPLGRGATTVLHHGRPNVRSVLRLVAEHGVSVLTGVPTWWSQLATFLDRHPTVDPLAGVRLGVSSGDSLPPAVLGHVIERTGIDLIEGLGCAECSNIVLSTRPGDPRPGTLGTIVGDAEVDLRDEDGHPVPDGIPGRLWIKSPSNTTGYWERPDATADVVHGDWLRMGDMLRRDGEIYRHVGRIDDIFKVDAQWVSPVEVEAVLHEHPAVAAAGVVGATDAAGLMRVAAAITPAGTPDDQLPEELRRLVAHRLAPYTAPTIIRFLEDLPRGATGKIDRRALRAIFAG